MNDTVFPSSRAMSRRETPRSRKSASRASPGVRSRARALSIGVVNGQSELSQPRHDALGVFERRPRFQLPDFTPEELGRAARSAHPKNLGKPGGLEHFVRSHKLLPQFFARAH